MPKVAGRDPVSSSGAGYEMGRLLRLIAATVSLQLDRSFELSSVGAARRRAQALLGGLLLFAAAYGLHALVRWRVGAFGFSAPEPGWSAVDALLIGWRTLLLLGIAASLAVHFAGLFLADIFELKDPRVAWKFVERVAAGAHADVLHIREGRLSDENRRSTIVQIGGPGRVVVDDDTAMLLEKPDGTPHVVGTSDLAYASGNQIRAAVELEGFERLREPLISLRDQYIGNPSGDPLTVVGRSLDGLPIGVTDVRGVFSVRREPRPAGAPNSAEHPFGFRAGDIENLIYRQSVAAFTSGEYASGTPGDWTAAMHGLLRDSLREFMADNRLADFLAGVGANEAEQSDFRADTILSRTLQVSSDTPGLPSVESRTPPRFRPRTELSAKFRKYGSEFSTRAQEHGMELHWIGVGTWNMPDEVSQDAVSAKHIEAWRQNRENATRVQTQALRQVSESALLEHKLRLIRDVPLAKHAKNQSRYSDKLVLMECLLQDYWEQLGDALDVHYRSGTPSRALDELEEAVAKVEQLLRVPQQGHGHGEEMPSRIRKRDEWDRSLEGPPAPASRAEAQQYQALLSRLKGDYRVAEAMIANEKRRHADLDREKLIARIVERFERHGREANNG